VLESAFLLQDARQLMTFSAKEFSVFMYVYNFSSITPSPIQMKKTLTLILALAISSAFTACSTMPQKSQTPTCETAYELPDDVAAQKIITIGEVHGTTEIPRAVGELACSFLKRGKSVVVGLEITDEALQSMLTYQTSAKTAADKAAIMQSKFWNPKMQDGRSSKAMFSLIAQLNQFKQKGLSIEIMAFDYLTASAEAKLKLSNDNYSLLRDQSMTEHNERMISANPEKTFILFAGNYHASKQKVLGSNPNWRSMAHLLSEKYPLTSFNADYRGGSAWNCRPFNGQTKCGANEMRGFSENESKPFIRIDSNWKMANFPKYDGTLYVGPTITASPPFVSDLVP
jgi:hypothetical protein